MQEFSSVTASSYDADSLAPLLSEKSADGWDVVSIVSAGTNIVAYLSREASGDSATADTTDDTAADDVVEVEAIEPIDEVADTPADPAPIGVPFVPEPAVEEPASEPVVEEASIAPVDEPAGWGTAPATTEPEPSVDDLAAQVAEPEPAPVVEPEPTPVVEPEPVAAVEPEPVAAAPVESAVPAGWYADPSGRYELRYWDGNAWTEHVSRAGQQFTDPPVA